MKKAEYIVTLNVTVFDAEELREAAKVEALKTMLAEDWDALRSSNFSLIAADLHMLLDPGVSPPGTKIENGDVEFIDGDDMETDEDATIKQTQESTDHA